MVTNVTFTTIFYLDVVFIMTFPRNLMYRMCRTYKYELVYYKIPIKLLATLKH